MSDQVLTSETIKHLCFYSHLLGDPSLPDPLDFYVHLFWKRTFRNKWHEEMTDLLRIRCHTCCHPTNCAKARKENHSTNPKQGNHPVASSFLDSPEDS